MLRDNNEKFNFIIKLWTKLGLIKKFLYQVALTEEESKNWHTNIEGFFITLDTYFQNSNLTCPNKTN